MTVVYETAAEAATRRAQFQELEADVHSILEEINDYHPLPEPFEVAGVRYVVVPPRSRQWYSDDHSVCVGYVMCEHDVAEWLHGWATNGDGPVRWQDAWYDFRRDPPKRVADPIVATACWNIHGIRAVVEHMLVPITEEE